MVYARNFQIQLKVELSRVKFEMDHMYELSNCFLRLLTCLAKCFVQNRESEY